MKIRLHGTLFLCMLSLMMTQSLLGRTCRAHSADNLFRLMNRYPLALCLFYYDRACQYGNCTQAAFASQLGVFEHLSRLRKYIDGGLLCIRVPVHTCSLYDIIDEYRLHYLPAFLLFRYSVPIRDQGGHVCALYGHQSMLNLEQYIDQHCKKTIYRNIRQREEERRIEREEARLRYMYYYPCMYWGCPYGLGCGCGWGCGWGGCGGYGWGRSCFGAGYTVGF